MEFIVICMEVLKKIWNYICVPRLILFRILNLYPSFIKNDELFLRLKWYFWCGKSLHLENPTTFNEKLQWLKLYDHQMQYSQMVDKITAKEFVASIIGERYIIPTLEVWNTVEDINFSQLPNRFVLKCSHNSGVIE